MFRTPAAGGSLAPEQLPQASQTLLTGVLGFDAIEGACGYVQAAGGTRYEVIYPSGWRIEPGAQRLVGPGGVSFGPGDKLTLKGSFTDGMASICQVGRIFRASEVVSGR